MNTMKGITFSFKKWLSGFASRFQHSLTRVLRNFFGFFGQGHRPPSPNVPIRLWTYLPVCLCLFVCLRTCLSICLPVSQSVSQSVCLSVCLSPCLPNYLPYTTYLPVPEKPFISDAFRETCKIRVKKDLLSSCIRTIKGCYNVQRAWHYWRSFQTTLDQMPTKFKQKNMLRKE